MKVLFKNDNVNGISKFLEFLTDHQCSSRFFNKELKNHFIKSKQYQIQWNQTVSICYEIYKSNDFQLVEFENVDIDDKELLIDISNKIEAIVTECGGIQLMYENLFEKYW